MQCRIFVKIRVSVTLRISDNLEVCCCICVFTGNGSEWVWLTVNPLIHRKFFRCTWDRTINFGLWVARCSGFLVFCFQSRKSVVTVLHVCVNKRAVRRSFKSTSHCCGPFKGVARLGVTPLYQSFGVYRFRRMNFFFHYLSFLPLNMENKK